MKTFVNTPAQRAEDRLSTLALILAPVLLSISTFYWKSGGGLEVIGGQLVSLAMIFWVMVARHLFSRLRDPLPNYAVWGFLVATIGCFAGNNFGFLGMVSEAMQITDAQQTAGMGRHEGAFALSLFMPGLLFPISMLALGIQLMRTKKIPLWVGLVFCLGAITFPMGRIPRLQWVAHTTDLLFLTSCSVLAWQLLRQRIGRPEAASQAQPAL